MPATVSPDIIYPWTRYWVPANTEVAMGGLWEGHQGYLTDPEDTFWGKQRNGHLKNTKELLKREAGCVVLFGEPGMGKSIALHSTIPNPLTKDWLVLEFRNVPSETYFTKFVTESKKMAEWRISAELMTLVIDGVDEGLIKISGFIEYLTNILNDEPLDRLQVILVCRSLEWPQSAGQQFINLWKKYNDNQSHCLYELCPLRERDVRLAAEQAFAGHKNISTDSFLRSIRKNQLIGLASRPLTLKMLIQEFSDGRKLTLKHKELYKRYSYRLCTEIDDTRVNRLKHNPSPRLQINPNILQKLAGRIAALLLVCGRSAIWVDDPEKAAPSDLTIDDICQGTEIVNGVETPINRSMIMAVLESALFWPKDAGRVSFYHLTFAECLASDYLSTLPFAQIRSLLFGRDESGEFVHPPLVELASWMADGSPELLEHILNVDPAALLRSDASGIKENQKARLIDAILTRAKNAEFFDSTGIDRFFHTLSHPDIAKQLRSVIHDRSANYNVHGIVLSIAEACKVTDLFEDIFVIINDPQTQEMQSLAANALYDLSDSNSKKKLFALVQSKNSSHLTKRTRYYAALALLKHNLCTFQDILPHVPELLEENSSENYIISEFVQPTDAEILFKACLKWDNSFDTLSPYNYLASKAYDLCLERISEPDVRKILAKGWYQLKCKHHSTFDVGRNADKPSLDKILKNNHELRLQFIEDIIALTSFDIDKKSWVVSELIKYDDFMYFLEKALQGPIKKRKCYANYASFAHDFEKHYVYWDQLLSALQQSKEVQAAFPWLRTWELDEPLAVQTKDNYYERQQLLEKSKQRQHKTIADPVKLWLKDLQEIENNGPEHWLNLAYRLFISSDGESRIYKYSHDVTTSPGWKYHSDEAHVVIYKCAKRFILETKGELDHTLGSISTQDMLVYNALFLIIDEVNSSVELKEAVQQHWIPIIFNGYGYHENHADRLSMMALAYSIDPQRMLNILGNKLVLDASQDPGISVVLRDFISVWDKQVSDFVIQVVIDKIYNPHTCRCIMEHLAEHDADAAILLWCEMRNNRGILDDCFIQATGALVTWRLFEKWEEIWPYLIADLTFTKKVFESLDIDDTRQFKDHNQSIHESKLAELLLCLLQIFPPHEDPPTPRGVYTPNRRMRMCRFRNEILGTLSSRGTVSAANELLRIANTLSDTEALGVMWHRHDALVASRRTAWQPPETMVVLQMVAKSERRWLQSEDDLLQLVIESLQRLESNLTKVKNSQRNDYWEVSHEAKKKYYKPEGEVGMSRRITTWLQMDLDSSKGIIVQREVQIQWNERTDIEISAVAINKPTKLRPLEITIEVKGCWHPAVRTAHKDQLVDNYLQRSGRTHGIYLVVWTLCDKWNDPTETRRSHLISNNINDARQELTKQVSEYDGRIKPHVVKEFLLDARL